MTKNYEKPEMIKVTEFGNGVLLESDGLGHSDSDYTPWIKDEPDD